MMNDTTPDNVYLNVAIQNNTTQNINAQFDTTKTIPVVGKANDYYLSVIRFDLPLNNVPLFIMPIVPNQPDPDLTPFIIGIEYPPGVFTEYSVQYRPQSDAILPPVQNVPGQQVITPYYYCYSYQTMMIALNDTITILLAAIPALEVQLQEYPYFIYESSTGLIKLVVDTLFVTGIPKPSIYINKELQTYLSSFALQFNSVRDGIYHNDYYFDKFPTLNTSANNYYGYALFGTSNATTGPIDFYYYVEEYPSTNLWAGIRKILITSNTLPVQGEIIPGTQSISFPIITDFVIPIEFAGQSRSVAYYNPLSQYRLVDLLSNDPIYKIDLQIYWEDTLGNFYPLQLIPGQQAGIKLAFVKKSLYKNILKKM